MGGGIIAAGALALYVLVIREPSDSEAIEAPVPTPASAPALTAPVHENLAPVAEPDQVKPWEATRENSPPVPAGQIPAWVVRPPAPDPAMPMPVEPAPSPYR
jgi:hypothetical protein